MGECKLCGRRGRLVSSAMGVCRECLLERPEEALRVVSEKRRKWRAKLGLPPHPPRGGSVKCRFCVNECELSEGQLGFCGVIRNMGGKLQPVSGDWRLGVVDWYLDPHPTNCVAVRVCPATTGRGYPRFTFTRGVERGFYNLAVFYAGCSLDCAYCQNWQHREMARRAEPKKSVSELVKAALNPAVTCVCFFGGDPGPHSVHALWSSRALLKQERTPRICWETNGVENPGIMKEMAIISLESGGIVKVDFKAWTPSVYEALTGVNGVERIKQNIKTIADMMTERPEPPLLVTSILLVPGYVTSEEAGMIAEYIAGVDKNIPVVLLAFHPEYQMSDLPPTSRRHAVEALKRVEEAGIREVYLENQWLLGDYY